VRGHRVVHAALVVVVAMWGLVFIAISRVLPEIDAVQLVVIRFTLIAIVFGSVMFAVPAYRPKLDGWHDWGFFVLLGLVGVPGAQLTIVNGQNYLSPPLVSLVPTTSPAWAAIIAAVWLRERVTRLQITGFVIALAGVTIVIVTGVGKGTGVEVKNPWGAALTIVSPICWALYTIMSKRLITRFPPVTAIGLAMITGSLSMLPLWPHAASGIGDLSGRGWAWMAYLVVGGTVVPYMVWWWGLNRLTATTTTAYMYAIPLAALAWAWLILGLVPTAFALVGGVVVIAGVAMIQFSRPVPPPVAAAELTP
jgi:drug/metabolite transporter (DMT)-like permease